jgi:glycosyltransferase domain-containing protein
LLSLLAARLRSAPAGRAASALYSSEGQITAIIPTRDHPQRLLAQLTLFADAGSPWKTIVADSTAADARSVVREKAERLAAWRTFPEDAGLYEKLSAVVAEIDSPFVLVTPDRKITLPHAVEAAANHLQTHPDCVAATGYVLGFDVSDGAFDINRFIYFTPTVGEDDPLRRHHHLMRRYQSSLWALFRKDALARCAALAAEVRGIMFREIAFMNALVLQGKLARLPVIFRAESNETSKTPIVQLDPLFWFVDNAGSFAEHYVRYRNRLIDFIVQDIRPEREPQQLSQLVDIIHAMWLNRSFDDGVLNHAAQLMLGDPLLPLPTAHPRPARRDAGAEDLIRRGQGRRQFIWRRDVLEAEPRDETRIPPGEMATLERQLERYFAVLRPDYQRRR